MIVEGARRGPNWEKVIGHYEDYKALLKPSMKGIDRLSREQKGP
jgi:hypothetical protein